MQEGYNNFMDNSVETTIQILQIMKFSQILLKNSVCEIQGHQRNTAKHRIKYNQLHERWQFFNK